MDTEPSATGRSDDETSDPLANPPSVFLNRRAYLRYAADESSNLLLVSHGLALQSHLLDLSLEGCRLCILDPYSVGSGTHVEVSFKVNGIAFRFAGVIQWTDESHLVGIHFSGTISRRSEQLAEVIVEMQRAAEARAPQDLIAERFAERAEKECETGKDPNSGVEAAIRNREMKRPGELAAPHSGDLAEREVRNWAEIQEFARKARSPHDRVWRLRGQTDDKRDRRIQVRHLVETTASVLLIKSGSKLRGHILDLSLTGCRIRTDERFPVGIYTRVETEFRLDGLPFLLGGVIQVIHDAHNVGIRFLDMSQRKREQVEQLIAEIAKLNTVKTDATLADSGGNS